MPVTPDVSRSGCLYGPGKGLSAIENKADLLGLVFTKWTSFLRHPGAGAWSRPRGFLGPALISLRAGYVASRPGSAFWFKCVPGKESPNFCFTPSQRALSVDRDEDSNNENGDCPLAGDTAKDAAS